MKKFVIGVLGGMGTYATIHLFEQYAKIFPAEKEWERPRIIIDNRCTMPSRVRAFLYNENSEQLIFEMIDSLQHLADSGCTKIILACNTSHLFLPEIIKRAPKLESIIENIIDNCVKSIKEDNIKSVFLLGSEGTINSKIYQSSLEYYNIKCIAPGFEDYKVIRQCIEAVKQNKITNVEKDMFIDLIKSYDACILGCTELPILYESCKDRVMCKKIYDPIYLEIAKLKKEYDNEKDINIWSV